MNTSISENETREQYIDTALKKMLVGLKNILKRKLIQLNQIL